ncbi:pyridoxamine 5'-phosphate oxidase family protein [Solidesulfovibrio sp.]|uniref:pyridoxamine 5'-phosphate oxidase family protein n=1 Tax=Solidesulfovibrio sp. TaxID=2910990 RepID=UPI00261230E6|nr:pyridoxamine 5'-phosphate oxidase family protein [Solidesulfovibrio sp.]
MELEAFARAARELLDAVPAMTLATCAPGPDGAPWATDVYFAPHGWELVFFSSPASRHCRNLAAAPACAATVHPQASSWRDIRGLQMEGRAGPVTGLAAKAAATAAYLAKFPFVKDLLTAPGETAGKLAKVSAHVFVPERIRYIDNSLGFGTRFSLRLADGRPAGPPEREEIS